METAWSHRAQRRLKLWLGKAISNAVPIVVSRPLRIRVKE
jgi:hypothetical protein